MDRSTAVILITIVAVAVVTQAVAVLPVVAAPPVAAVQAVASGSSNASRGVNGVYNLTTARNFLAGYCPGVNIESVNGSTSYYDPNRNMIMLGTNIIGGENRVYFVVMHELMHHYQNQQYSSQQWSTKLANGTLETEADRMTFQVAPNLMGQGHYTNSTASGAERSRLQQVINNGRAAGC